MSRSVRVILGVVLALVLLVAAVAGLAFWKLSSLKEQLRAGLAKSLDADVEVASLDIDPWKSELHAAGIKLTNQRSSSPWEKGDIAQATVHYRFADLLSSPLKVQVELTTWNLRLHSPLRTNEAPPSTDTGGGSEGSSAPKRLQVTQIIAHEGTVEMDFADDRKFTINGVGFTSTEDGDIWTTQAQVTSVQAGTLALGAGSVKIEGGPGQSSRSPKLQRAVRPGRDHTARVKIGTSGQHDTQITLKGVRCAPDHARGAGRGSRSCRAWRRSTSRTRATIWAARPGARSR